MDYSAANTSLWGLIIQLGLIAGAILLADFMRRKIPFIKKTMMPVAVLGGFLLLIAKYLGLKLDNDFMEILVFHGIALGFIAMSLRVPPKKEKADKNLTGFKSGAVIVSSYMVQGLTGLLITLLLSYTVMPDLFRAAGLLLPMGYGQGPGQANNVGSTYETLGFAGGRSFGMAIAAAGYLVACIVGVIILNILKNKGLIKEPAASGREMLAQDYFEGEKKSGISESIDVLSIQAALMLLVYLVTYLVIRGITSGIAAAAPGVAATVNPLFWGFNFIVGSALAILFRTLLVRFGGTGRRGAIEYQNNYLLNRISGFFFDIMIVAGIASIEIEDIRGLWVPFFLLAIVGGIVTWVHLCFVSKAVYRDYYYQGLISMFGMMTGTISSGVLLLREIDPELATPAANNLIVGSSFGIILGAPILVLVGMAPKSPALAWTTVALLAAYLCVLYLIIFKLRAGKKR